MDRVKLVLKAQVASDAIIAHVTRAKAVLAETEEEWLLGVHDVHGKLKEARKELAAALRIMRRTVWPKGGASDAYVRWRSDQLSADPAEE